MTRRCSDCGSPRDLRPLSLLTDPGPKWLCRDAKACTHRTQQAAYWLGPTPASTLHTRLIRDPHRPGDLWVRVTPAGKSDLPGALQALASTNPDGAAEVRDALERGAHVQFSHSAMHLHDDGSGDPFTDEFWVLTPAH